MKGTVAVIVLLAAVAAAPAEGTPSESVTMAARQSAANGRQSATLFGTVDSRKAEEVVTIEAKDCGRPSFTEVKSARTVDGGAWTVEYWPGVNTTLRAKWRGAVSTPVALGQRAWVWLSKTRGKNEFQVGVTGKVPAWRKRVLIQRRQSGGWKSLKTVVLTEQIALGQTGAVMTRARFEATVPRGALLRAVLPRAQAKPCYLVGVSEPERA